MRKLLFLLIIIICSACSRVPNKQMVIHETVVKSWLPTKEEKKFSYKWLTEDECQERNIAQRLDLNNINHSVKILCLEAKGLVPGTKYDLYKANCEFGEDYIATFNVVEDGTLFSIKDGLALENWEILLGNDFLMGEPIYFVLIPKDDQPFMSLMVIPEPIEVKWDDGAQMSLVLFNVKNSLYVNIGSGFRPNEEWAFESTSCTETLNAKQRADEKGRTMVFFFPAVIGQTGGVGQISITRAQKEPKLLRFNWGTQNLKK